MMTVILLIILAIAIISLALVYGLLPLFNHHARPLQVGNFNNQALYQARIAELDRSAIEEEQKQALRVAIEQLIEPVSASQQWLDSPRKNKWLLLAILVTCFGAITLGAVLLRAESLRFSYYSNKIEQQSNAFLTGESNAIPTADGLQNIDLLQSLQAHAYGNPSNATVWFNLAQVYESVGGAEQADQILSRLYRQFGSNNDLVVQTAAMQLPRPAMGIHPDTLMRLAEVIKRNPANESALMQYAMLSIKTQKYDQGITALQQLQSIKKNERGADSNAYQMLGTAILTAQKDKQQYYATLMQVNVGISDALRNQLKNSDTLFVIVKSARPNDPPMPYAAVKLPVQALLDNGSATVALTLESAMAPGRSIGTAQAQNIPLAVQAKISASGNPMTQSGDFVSQLEPLGKPGTYQVNIASMAP